MKYAKPISKGKIIAIIGVVLLIIVLIAILAIRIYNDRNLIEETTEEEEIIEIIESWTVEEEEVETEEEIEIYSGTDRPIAVMIDNHTGAWPQAALNQAYLVYEIIVEGRRN